MPVSSSSYSFLFLVWLKEKRKKRKGNGWERMERDGLGGCDTKRILVFLLLLYKKNSSNRHLIVKRTGLVGRQLVLSSTTAKKSTKSAKCLCLSLSIELRTGGGHWCEHLLPGHCVIPLDFHWLPLFQFPHIHTDKCFACLSCLNSIWNRLKAAKTTETAAAAAAAAAINLMVF